MRRFKKVLRDPIYGYIGVTEEELSVIKLPVFQRLRRISQLSFANLVYPGANHTRFAHCLGVLHLAEVIGGILREVGYISSEEARVLRWAGLLHDIGHGPFSHAFEPVLAHFVLKNNEIDDAHVRYGQQVIFENPEIYERIGGKEIARQVCTIIGGKGYQGEDNPSELMKSVMTGDFSIDRLDYLKRDAYHTGTPEYGIIDTERVLYSFLWYPETRQVYYSKKGIYALAEVFLSYFNMYNAVYFHHATRAAYFLCQDILWDAFSQGVLNKTNYEEMWQDFDDFKCLEMINTGCNKAIKEKISLLLHRKLPKRILDTEDFEQPRRLVLQIGHLCQSEKYREKIKIEKCIRKKLKVKTFYIDSIAVSPYPLPSSALELPPYIALNEQDPFSSNTPLHELVGYLKGLWEPKNITRVYMEEIWENDEGRRKLKAKVLDVLKECLS